MKFNRQIHQDLIDSGLLKRHNDFNSTAFYSPSMHKKPDFTYVLCGYFPGYSKPIRKIGYSTNALERYRSICRQSPYPLFLDYLIAAPFDMERALHKAFKKSRVTNKFCSSGETEWFIGLSNEEIISTANELYLNAMHQQCGLYKPLKIDYSKYFNPDADRYLKLGINYKSMLSEILTQ